MLDHEKTVDDIITFYADLMDHSEPIPERAHVEEMVLAAPGVSVEQVRRVIPPSTMLKRVRQQPTSSSCPALTAVGAVATVAER